MGNDEHVSRELLAAILEGRASPRLLADFVQRHLMDLCPECRAELEAFRREQRARARGQEPVSADRYERAYRSAEAELRAADWLVQHLRSLAPAKRLEVIRREPRRYGSPAVVRLLLEEGRGCLPEDPAGARAWAEAAEAALTSDPQPPPALVLRTAAHLANVQRIEGERRQAAESFLRFRRLQETLDVHDPEVLAEVARLEASLHIDLGRYQRAEGLLHEALAYYRRTQQLEEVADVLLQKSHLLYQAGELERAIETTWEAEEMACLCGDERTRAYARFNHASILAEAGRHEEARDFLVLDEKLFARHFDPLNHLRVVWLEGRIEAAIGDPESAVAAFREARDGFAEHHQGFDCALVSLDLAALYCNQGRWEEVQRACVEAVTLFEANAVHRDALAALLLLRDAALAQKLELEAIEKVTRYLRDAERVPATGSPSPS